MKLTAGPILLRLSYPIQGPDLQRYVSQSNELVGLTKNLRKTYEKVTNILIYAKILRRSYEFVTWDEWS